MSPTDADFPPDLRALEREYELIREIGQGGMAAVYLARKRASGQLVAIKAIRGRYLDDPDAVKRFAREAQTVAGLNHPNIVRVEAIEQIDDRAIAIIMEHVPGGTVRDRLREHGSLGAEDAEAILRDVAHALRYAHQRGIVHRDVKPENIFLDSARGRAVLSDFGIARSISGDTSITLLGAALGTPQYMSPEQIDGAVVDGRSDIYSLGVLGWELLTGRRPWAGESLYGIIYKQKHEDLPRITSLRPRVPANLLFAIEGALKKNRDERFQAVDEFLDQLTYNPPPLLSQTFPPGVTRASDAPTVVFRSASLTSESEDIDVVRREDIEPAPGQPAPAFFVGESGPPSVLEPTPTEPMTPVDVAPKAESEAAAAVERAVSAAPAASRSPLLPPSVVRPPQRQRRALRTAALVIPLVIAGTTLYIALGGRANSSGRRAAPSVNSSAGSVASDSAVVPSSVAVLVPTDTVRETSDMIIDEDDPDTAYTPLYPKPSRPLDAPKQDPSAKTPTGGSSTTSTPSVSDVSRATPETVATPNAPSRPLDKAPSEPVLEDPFKMPPASDAAAAPRAASGTKGSVPTSRCRLATNADQTACLSAYIAEADGPMDGAFEALVSELRRAAGTAPSAPDPVSVGRVRVEQRAWLSVRNAECPREPAPGAGSFWAHPTSACFSEMAAARAAELREAVRRLRNSRDARATP